MKLSPRPRSSKYGAVKTNGYASKKEAARAGKLKWMVDVGAVRNLREQVRYELIPAQYQDGKCVERSVVYVADFVYEYRTYEGEPWLEIVEDCKGMRTPAYVIRRKLFRHKFGRPITEI